MGFKFRSLHSAVYQNENLTHETYVMMGVFTCVKTKFNTRISWR